MIKWYFRCRNLILLETYTSLKGEDLKLPDFLSIVREVTEDPYYSMYNLSRKDDCLDKRRMSESHVGEKKDRLKIVVSRGNRRRSESQADEQLVEVDDSPPTSPVGKLELANGSSPNKNGLVNGDGPMVNGVL